MRLCSSIAIVALLFAIATTPSLEGQLPPTAATETVEYASGALRLSGFVFRPAGAGPHPAVLFLHGANGATERSVGVIGETFTSRGYLLFFPFRRGLGPSAGQGEAVLDRLAREGQARGDEARMRLMAELLATEQLQDVLGSVDYIRSRAEVDPERVAIFGHSFGGILGVLAAERSVGLRAVVSAATAAQNWAAGPGVRDLLRASARNARIPIFLFQAANDYDLTPSEELAAELAGAGKTHFRKVYPAWGQTNATGHGFAITAPRIWGPDVFGFLSEQLK